MLRERVTQSLVAKPGCSKDLHMVASDVPVVCLSSIFVYLLGLAESTAALLP